MNLELAIVHLDDLLKGLDLPGMEDYESALNLGIESLKRERANRDHRIPGWNALLPGETDE